jgi:UDP-GlcNAc:undecaprenyl-phosphate GlcNAc-1-phosphate transferase
VIAVYSFVFALFVASALVPVLMRWAAPLGLMDQPGARKIHHAPVPRIGGIAIIVAALLAILLFSRGRHDLVAYVVASLVLGVFGVVDDRVNLSYRWKFVGQILAALVVVFWGGVLITRFPFSFEAVLPLWFAVPFTVFALVGITNAVNLSDGMDGLAGGTGLLAAGALGFLAWLGGDKTTALLAVCLIGATLGFLRYNTFPARVFLGDAGSQFLGFSVGVLAVMTVETANRAISPMVAVLILGLPILDTLYVMTRRVLEGRSPFSPDRRHIHHRLLDMGLDQYEAVVVAYSAQVVLILLAWWLAYARDELLLGVYLAFGIGVLYALRLAERHGLPHLMKPGRESPVTRAVEFLRRSALLGRVPRQTLLLAIPAWFVVAPLLADSVAPDIGWLALALLAGLLFLLSVRRLPFFAFERLTVYAVAAASVFLVETSPGLIEAVGPVLRGFFVLLVVLIALWLRFGGRRAFRFNAMDFLIMAMMVALPNIPGVKETGLGVVAVETLVLFYAAEIIITDHPRGWDSLRYGVITALVIIAARGVFGV